jgi:hypothetical protein
MKVDDPSIESVENAFTDDLGKADRDSKIAFPRRNILLNLGHVHHWHIMALGKIKHAIQIEHMVRKLSALPFADNASKLEARPGHYTVSHPGSKWYTAEKDNGDH